MKHLTSFAVAGLLLLVLAPAVQAAGRSPTRAALDMTLPEMKFTNVPLVDAIDFLRDVSGANLHVNWKALESVGVGKETNINVRLRNVSLRKVLNLVLGDAAGGDSISYYIDQGVIEITTKELADQKMYTKVYPVEDLIMEIPDFDDAPQLSLSSTGSGTSGTSGTGTGTSGSSGTNNSLFGNSGGSGGGYGSGSGSSSGNGSGSSQGKTKQERADDLITLIMDIIRPEIWKDNGGPASIRFWNGNLIITAPRSVHEAIGGPMD